MSEGGSTRVYRIRTGGSVFYLRVLPEAETSFIPEALVHQILRSSGVRVPDVLLVESENPDLHQSIMVTSEMAGSPLGYGEPTGNTRMILREAGSDLASINHVSVDGFGWIRRDRAGEVTLSAEFSTYSEWIDAHYRRCPSVLAAAGVLTQPEARTLDDLIAREAGSASSEQAYLAHGDFDLTHIYCNRGRYTGIIDFGEIRGTPALYDLGHFQIENRDFLRDLLAGYAPRAGLRDGYRRQIDFFSLIIALRRLSRHVETGRKLLPADLVEVSRARLPL